MIVKPQIIGLAPLPAENQECQDLFFFQPGRLQEEITRELIALPVGPIAGS